MSDNSGEFDSYLRSPGLPEASVEACMGIYRTKMGVTGVNAAGNEPAASWDNLMVEWEAEQEQKAASVTIKGTAKYSESSTPLAQLTSTLAELVENIATAGDEDEGMDSDIDEVPIAERARLLAARVQNGTRFRTVD